MASNISEIGDAINNLNVTFEPINVSNILYDSIEYGNQVSNGWMGIFTFMIMSMSILIYVYRYRQEFLIFNKYNVLLFSISIMLDLGFYLILFGILQQLYVYGSLFAIFFVLLYVSLIRKDMKEVSS